MQKFAKTRLTALAAAIAGAGVMVGCTEVPNSSPIIENPTSDVIGKVTDAGTGQPIEGVKVIVDGLEITAKTDEFGVYVLKDVPANNPMVVGGGATYTVSLDMTDVSSPVDMSEKDDCTPAEATETTAAVMCNFYPDLDTIGNTISVTSSSAGDGGDGGGSAVSIGETGIVNSNADLMVGKASTDIMGHVYDEDTTTAVSEEVTVELWYDANGNGTVPNGADELIATTTVKADDAATTDADEGMFHFHGVQAGFDYVVVAKTTSREGTFATLAVTKENVDIDVDTSGRLVLNDSDVTSPAVSHVSIAGAHDFASDATVAVTWTFNEAIALDPMGYRDSIAAGGDLYEDVIVTYNGPKAGEVAKTITWDTTFTQMTVTVDSAKTGADYTITVSGMTGNLEDAAGNAVTIAVGEDRNFTVAYAAEDAPAAPASIAITNPGDLTTVTHNQGSVDIFWTPVSGVAGYNLYRTATVGGAAVGTVRIADWTTQTAFTYNDTMNDAAAHNGLAKLVNGENEAVSYTYNVAGVNSEGVEGAMAAAATSAVADKVAPTGITANCSAGTSPWGGSEVEITFNEPVVKSLAETIGNYTGLATGSKYIVYDEAANMVTVGYDDSAAPVCTAGGADDNVSASTAITDVAGNAPGAALAAAAF